MGTVYVRGGIPRVLSGTAKQSPAAADQRWEWKEGVSNHIVFENLDPSSQITLYFTEKDAAAETNGIIVPAGWGGPGNPLNIPAEMAGFWCRSTPGDAAFSCLVLLRRG